MKKERLKTTEFTFERIMHISLLIYLFLLIFPHTTTLREISFWTAAICWVLLRLRKSEPFIPLNPIIISLSLFIGIALISSVIGMHPFENLKRFKGELLSIFILFLIVATEYKTIQKAKSLFISPVVAFAVYTLLTVGESFNYGLPYFWDNSFHKYGVWIDGYTQKGITLFPLTLSMFLLNRDNRFKYFFLFFAIIEFFIIAAYGRTTPFISVTAVLLLCTLFAQPRKYRWWAAGFITGVISLFIVFFNVYGDNPALTEYKTKFCKIIRPAKEFEDMGGFSNRMVLWHAATDIIKERPFFGYGWGMKKYTEIIQNFSDKWKITKPYIYLFYKEEFRPPHNLFLEISIQSGLLGLATFIVFIGMYLLYLIKRIIIYNNSDTYRNFSIILIGGTIMSFMVMNLMNNELGNISGEILFVVLGTGAGLINDVQKIL